MKVEDLKSSVTEIHMKDNMRRDIIENVKSRTGNDVKDHGMDKGNRKKSGKGAAMDRNLQPQSMDRQIRRWYKAAAAAAVLIVVSGIIAFPVRALVNSLVQERMEEMPEEKVEEILETANSSLVEADGFSRAYTDSERNRYESLAQKYQQGIFPKQEIIQVENETDIKEDTLCFIVSTSTFSLPERELTDEEILEIIDFYVKRDYAYQQNYEKEYAEEIAQKEEEQKKQIADNVAQGGVTQQQAIEIAKEKLGTFFEVDEEGMELNCHYVERSYELEGDPCYSINWSNIVTHQTYYVDVRAKDGQVMWAAQTDPNSVDAEEPTIEEAREKIDGLKEKAQKFMEEKAGLSYEKIYAYYLEYTDGTAYKDGVRFVFETQDQEAYGVTYLWDGTFKRYAVADLSDYHDGGIRTLHLGGNEVKFKEVFIEL